MAGAHEHIERAEHAEHTAHAGHAETTSIQQEDRAR